MRNFNYTKYFKKIVKMTKLQLVPFTLGITMITGCSNDKNSNMIKSQAVNCSSLESFEELPEEEWYYKPFAKKGYECEFLVKGLFRVKRRYNVNYSLNNIYADDYHREKFYFDNLEEFRDYVEVKNPTYDDVRKTVEENVNINNQYKNYLYECLDNLEKNASDLDLIALYHNIKDLKIVNCYEEDFNNFYGGLYFYKTDKCLKINPDMIKKDDFCREVVGKGIMSAAFVDEDEDIEYCYEPTTEVIRADQSNVWSGNLALMINMYNKDFRQLYDYIEFSSENAEFVIERFLVHYAANKLYLNETDMVSIKTDISETLDSGDSLTLENIEKETLEIVETLSNEDELQKVYSKEYEYYDF